MIDETNFKPLRGLLLIRRDTPDENNGLIFVPEVYREFGRRATVLRCGPKVAADFAPGDVIWFAKDDTVLPFKDRTLALTEGKKVMAKMRLSDCVERIFPSNDYVLIAPDAAPVGIDVNLTDGPGRVSQGIVVRAGSDTTCSVGARVWYFTTSAAKCCEYERKMVLVREANILMFKIS